MSLDLADGLADLAVDCSALRVMPGNPRVGDIEAIARSLKQFGQRKPVVANRDGTVLAGNHTLLAARSLGWERIAAVYVDDDDATARAYALADNRTAELGDYDNEALAALIGQVRAVDAELLAATGWSEDEYTALLGRLADEQYVPANPGLAERFGVPPLSVLDARAGYWMDRKAEWKALGLASGAGRPNSVGANYQAGKGPVTVKIRSGDSGGLSIFDPVLAELCYRWYCRPGGRVLDPFAGGSARGVVAAATGRRYLGVDLSAPQIAANEAQWQLIGPRLGLDTPAPEWTVGASQTVVPALAGPFDLVFSCPPYADLEQYSTNPDDLSTMPYDEFMAAYRQIIAASVALLAPERFAVFVVGDVPGPGGFLRPFVSDTIEAFVDAGAKFLSDAVLVTPVATVALRAAASFSARRTLARCHQRVLVFYWGDDPRNAVDQLGPAAFGDLPVDGSD